MPNPTDLGEFFNEEFNKQHFWFHIRMDTHVSHEVMKELISKFKSVKWAYCRETTTKDHTHLVISTKLKSSAPTLSRWISDIAGLKGPQKSCSTMRTSVLRMLTYICKEKDLYYEGFAKTFVAGCKAQATKKFNKEDFANDIFNLESSYAHGKINFHELGYQYSELKAAYNQNHTRSSVKTYLTKQYFKKNSNARRQYYMNITKEIVSDCADYEY